MSHLRFFACSFLRKNVARQNNLACCNGKKICIVRHWPIRHPVTVMMIFLQVSLVLVSFIVYVKNVSSVDKERKQKKRKQFNNFSRTTSLRSASCTSAVNVTLLAFAAARRAEAQAAAPLPVGRPAPHVSIRNGAQQQTRRTPRLLSNDGTDRETETYGR